MPDRKNPSHHPAPAEAPDRPQAGFGSPRAAFRAAILMATGAPAVVLGASYIGFGSLVRASDLTVLQGVISSTTGWALPGQIALVELYAVGANLPVIVVAVALTNARLLPMSLSLLPILQRSGVSRWKYYAVAHLIAVTSWVVSMKECPTLPREERLAFFTGFASTLISVTTLCTIIGFYLAGTVPAYVSLGLVFLNPIYFMLLLTADLQDAGRFRAILLGAILGPLMHLAFGSWGLLITGLVAGSLAFASLRLRHRDRHV